MLKIQFLPWNIQNFRPIISIINGFGKFLLFQTNNINNKWIMVNSSYLALNCPFFCSKLSNTELFSYPVQSPQEPSQLRTNQSIICNPVNHTWMVKCQSFSDQQHRF